jgi:putative ABC transport system substrate-binding protein
MANKISTSYSDVVNKLSEVTTLSAEVNTLKSRERLAALAAKAGLPTVCGNRRSAEEGCLIGYGPDLAELRRRAADDVARIFRGAAPGEIPIEGPTHFDFVVNLKTAKVLGLTMPPLILARADEVIE